jgi:hypothetical protein
MTVIYTDLFWDGGQYILIEVYRSFGRKTASFSRIKEKPKQAARVKQMLFIFLVAS